MNFTAVRGYNAYAQFSAKIREAVKSRTEATKDSEALQDISLSTYAAPVDTVSISKSAQDALAALKAIRESSNAKSAPPENKALSILRESSPHIEFREWARTSNISSGIATGSYTQKIPGSVMNEALAGSGITVGDNEEFDLNIDFNAVTISGKNTEKARAIQNLLHSMPSYINWGLLLATLPPA